VQSLSNAIIESWDRSSRIISNEAKGLDPESLSIQTLPDEWPIVQHLCHVHGTRRHWLSVVAPEFSVGIERLYTKVEGGWVPIDDLTTVVAELDKSALQIRKAMEVLLEEPKPIGPYSHPVFFLQHMIWHEGWHTSSIMQALRSQGKEFAEEWEGQNVWAIWRS
jgi:uncharacterized damage-inducible protein DinB